MLIWINGARGCGKTQTAAELCRRTEHSFFYDPEEIGYCLRKTTPKALWHDDFQDNPLWRAMNITMLKKLCHDGDERGLFKRNSWRAQGRHFHKFEKIWENKKNNFAKDEKSDIINRKNC